MQPQETPQELVLSEPAQFKALGHPLRHRLLLALRGRPATFAQLAVALGVAKGTVGYHVKLLEEAGLVRVAHVRQVRGGTEQYYEPTSQRLRIAAPAPGGGGVGVHGARAAMLPADEGAPDVTILRHVRLGAAQARALAATLERFANGDEMAEQESGETYGVLLSLYRTDQGSPRTPGKRKRTAKAAAESGPGRS
ncbi:helix-turn-helix domain-containing protein [Actinoplanes sp. NPDC051411]|uniref:helix-turn-helix domain-containing protein n=1 Tax=Actinoplanes sp. NPDC051411 TaxID=3155522 RepID=UPI0034375592